MLLRMSEADLREMIEKYLLEELNLKEKDNFMFYLKIMYYDGSYDTDSYYYISSEYSYTEDIIIQNKKYTGRISKKFSIKEILDILGIIFDRDGYIFKFSFYDRNGIVFTACEKEKGEIKLELK